MSDVHRIGVLTTDERGRPYTSWQAPTALLYVIQRSPRRGRWVVRELTAAAWVELNAQRRRERRGPLDACLTRDEAERDAAQMNQEDEINALLNPPVPHE